MAVVPGLLEAGERSFAVVFDFALHGIGNFVDAMKFAQLRIADDCL